jgi:hypothetical protein
MISHRYKCIFVEVPKTGSTSIRSLLGVPPKPHMNICQMKYELENYWTHHGGIKNRVMASLYLLLTPQRRAKIGETLFHRYFKFGFVRNPWDRVVSLYERREGMQLREKMSFEKFVSWMSLASSTCIHPMPHRNQLDWFVDPHGNVAVDFIGRFEQLESHWKLICRRLGIDEPLPHNNRNPGRTRHYTDYYNAETREIIARRFRVDIEYFEYSFDGCNASEPYRFDSKECEMLNQAPPSHAGLGSTNSRCTFAKDLNSDVVSLQGNDAPGPTVISDNGGK